MMMEGLMVVNVRTAILVLLLSDMASPRVRLSPSMMAHRAIDCDQLTVSRQTALAHGALVLSHFLGNIFKGLRTMHSMSTAPVCLLGGMCLLTPNGLLIMRVLVPVTLAVYMQLMPCTAGSMLMLLSKLWLVLLVCLVLCFLKHELLD